MANGKFISYLRVSTQKQGKSGLGLEAQQTAVAGYLNGGAWTLVAEVVEVESGKNGARPKLAEALRLCRMHKATLVVAKLDRLARNVAFVATLLESGVKVVCCDMPDADVTMLHIYAVMAEREGKAISARTVAALAAAKARGVVLGGYRWEIDAETRKRALESSISTRKEVAATFAADVLHSIADVKTSGAVSLRDIAAGLNERKVPTARGGEWTAVQVSRVLKTA